MEAASLNLPTTAAQANAFMTSMAERKDTVLPKQEPSQQETTVKNESAEESASGIVPTLQYAHKVFCLYASNPLEILLPRSTLTADLISKPLRCTRVTLSTTQRWVLFVLAKPVWLTCQRFAAVIMRIREPKTTALIFASGKMVVTGAKSEDDSKLASRKYARIIQKLGFNAKFTDFKIQNIVGSCDVKFPIRLEGLAFSHGTFSSYEPELFPGLIYRMVKPKIVLLIFVSGKIVLTGAKQREEIYAAFEAIYPVLSEFRKA